MLIRRSFYPQILNSKMVSILRGSIFMLELDFIEIIVSYVIK